jgi:UDP-glucose 4-epimerase
MEHEKDFNGEVYDVGTGQSCSLMDIKGHIDNIFDVTWDLQPERHGDIKNSRAEISKLENLGWKAQINLETGLQRCLTSVGDK